MNRQRRNVLEDLKEKFEELQGHLEELKDEEEDAFNNIPESFSGSERYENAEATVEDLEGAVDSLGEVIGYLGMTGYSTKENVNNINTPHLHWGMQLIFDESQKDAVAEIWIDIYAITRLLEQNKSAVYRPEGEKDFFRKYQMFEPDIEVFNKD